MKIWFDASPSSSTYGANDCKDCKDCVNPIVLPEDISYPAPDATIAEAQTYILQHTRPLHIEPCCEERWLVCAPTGSGRIAVFDAEALSLLSLFNVPTTIAQVAQKMAAQCEEHIVHISVLLYQLGFLQTSTSSPKIQPPSHTLTAWLHVTNECNLRCHYCYISKTKDTMSTHTGRQAVDALMRSVVKHKLTRLKLRYAGGEASLHMQSVIALHDYALQRAEEYGISLEANIICNGVVLSQGAIDALKARSISVTISLDGLGSAHDDLRPLLGGKGSNHYVLRTIDRLLTNKVVPFISVTVAQYNLNGLPELMRYILGHNLPFSLNYYRENDNSASLAHLGFSNESIITAMYAAFAVLEEQLPAQSLLDSLLDKANLINMHHHTCGVGQNYLVIDQHGGVAKCQMEIQRTITTVNVEDPLSIIRQDRRGIQGPAVEEKEGCRTCDWRYWCTGGCPLVTYRATGRYDVKSPNCAIYKALFPEILRLEALRLLRYMVPVEVALCV